MKEWFTVSKEGLRELQLGKPKHYVLRELIQNAWDEPIKECRVSIRRDGEYTIIIVEDDSPVGFRDLSHSYTLFGKTYKRKDPEKRGRFNLGEKQAFSICEECLIKTTKGTVIFDNEGRREASGGTKKGTIVRVKLKTTQREYEEMIEVVKRYLVPKNIRFMVNGETIKYIEPDIEFSASLLTEWEKDGVLRANQRKTNVQVFKVNGQTPLLYEMGLPVTEIDCQFSINVQQRVPLAVDRETVSQSFLKDLYAEVLNHTIDLIEKEKSSDTWIRVGMTDDRVDGQVVRGIVKKRYGDKVCVANPFDKVSVDEAIAHGYNVIRGSEMSKKEWSAVRDAGAIESSSALFGASGFGGAEIVKDLTENQKAVKRYAKKIAKRLLGFDLKVVFVKAKSNEMASFGDKKLSLNLTNLPSNFFNEPVSEKTTDLIVHELGHYVGMHTEKQYHQLLTKLGAGLVMVALSEPEFFKVNGK